MSFNITRTTTSAPTLTLDEVKAFIRVDFDTDDDLITSMIDQSRDLIEQYTNSSMVDSDIVLIASKRESLVLPYSPVNVITSIVDIDDNAIDYTYDKLTVELKATTTFTVTYSTTGTVPDGLKLGWLEIMAYLYEQRGDTSQIALILYYNKNLMPYRRKIWI